MKILQMLIQKVGQAISYVLQLLSNIIFTSFGDKMIFMWGSIVICLLFDIWLVRFILFKRKKYQWKNPNDFIFRVSVMLFFMLFVLCVPYYLNSTSICNCVSIGKCTCPSAVAADCISTGNCDCASTGTDNCTKIGLGMSLLLSIHTAVNAMTTGMFEEQSGTIHTILRTINAYSLCKPVSSYLNVHFIAVFLLAPLVTASWVVSALSTKTIETIWLWLLNFCDWVMILFFKQRAVTTSVVFLNPSQFSLNIAKSLKDEKGIRLIVCNCDQDMQKLSPEMSLELQNIVALCLSRKVKEYRFSPEKTYFVNCGKKIDELYLTNSEFYPQLKKNEKANYLIFSMDTEADVQSKLKLRNTEWSTQFFSVYDVLAKGMISRKNQSQPGCPLLVVGCGELAKAVISCKDDIRGAVTVFCEEEQEYQLLPSWIDGRRPKNYGNMTIEGYCISSIESSLNRNNPVTVMLASDSAKKNFNRRNILQKHFSSELEEEKLRLEVLCDSEAENTMDVEKESTGSIAHFGSIEGAVENHKTEILSMVHVGTKQ